MGKPLTLRSSLCIHLVHVAQDQEVIGMTMIMVAAIHIIAITIGHTTTIIRITGNQQGYFGSPSIGVYCNGSKTDFDSVSPGSSPGTPSKFCPRSLTGESTTLRT